MRIQHNIRAINAERQSGITEGILGKSATKLSSGYKINIAADDAAGLSISEKMRRQIRGLNQGIANTEDGVSLCQIADGALTEVHDMLQRINELAVKAKNGTNSTSDRRDINNEVSALLTEIDRIGDTTKFNELFLFKGGRGKKTEEVQTVITLKPTAMSKFFKLVGSANTSTTGYMQEKIDANTLESYNTTSDISKSMLDGNGNPYPYVSVHIDFKELIDDKQGIAQLAGTNFYVNCCTDCCPTKVEFTNGTGFSRSEGSDMIGYYNVMTIKIGLKKADGSYYSSANEFVTAITEGLKNDVWHGECDPDTVDIGDHVMFACENNTSGTTLYMYDIHNRDWTQAQKEAAYYCDYPTDEEDEAEVSIAGNHGASVWIQSGCDAGDGLMLHVGYMNAEVLGIDELDVLTEDNSEKAIRQVSRAIKMISAQRSRIGAYQNRLEHTIANEQNVVENTTAAESQIRDTDMAEEMVKYSNTNILMQAGQSMLAQANQSGQGILSLLSA